MMKINNIWFPGIVFLLIQLPLYVYAQSVDEESVRNELKEMNRLEQEAFITGDCDQLIHHMAEDVQFYANGMKPPSKEVIRKFCENVPRPINNNTESITNYYVLGPRAGYIIKEMTIKRPDGKIQQEYVTKVWKKGDEGWKITHLHSTVKVQEENIE